MTALLTSEAAVKGRPGSVDACGGFADQLLHQENNYALSERARIHDGDIATDGSVSLHAPDAMLDSGGGLHGPLDETILQIEAAISALQSSYLQYLLGATRPEIAEAAYRQMRESDPEAASAHLASLSVGNWTPNNPRIAIE
ncbi:hypothetical protein OIU35_18910 [Boseaceae bacterium BT-24-1]|nr:hypothetical protein [Boseaceae bacterium BT-24-1]